MENLEVLLHQNRILKPMLCSAFSHPNHRHHHKRCSNADNDFTIENYTNENRSTSFTSGIPNMNFFCSFIQDFFHCIF